MKDDINNFWGYMPGGFYRKRISDPESSVLPDHKRLVEAIDLYLAQIGFDNQRYRQILGIYKKAISKYRDLIIKGEDQKAEHHGKRAHKFSDLEYELSKPIYDHMLSVGFPESLLIG